MKNFMCIHSQTKLATEGYNQSQERREGLLEKGHINQRAQYFFKMQGTYFSDLFYMWLIVKVLFISKWHFVSFKIFSGVNNQTAW